MNSEGTLPLAIASVYAQTFTDWELLLIDDGSSDRSLDIARSIRDPRVKVFSDGANRGLPARLNALIRAANADIVVRMDADDAMLPRRLELQVDALRDRPDVQLVGGTSYLMNASERVYGHHIGPELDPDPALFLRQRGGFPFHHPSIAGRRDWFIANPYDETFLKGQEKELFCRTYGASTFLKIQDPVIFYREGGTMKISTYRITRRNDRRVLQMYGTSLLGSRRKAIAYALTYAREAIYVTAHRTGAIARLDEGISRRRAGNFSPLDAAAAQALLEDIRRTPVPGLDG
jgi:glycosyltransferase involved in cell wall biosynthesis